MALKRGGLENLIPVRSKEEAREKGKKGGIASGEARREKRTLRQCLELLLSLPAPEGHGGQDTSEAVSAALIKRALNGDVAAFTALRDSIGEKPTDKVEHSGEMDLAMAIAEGRKRASKF